MQSVRPAPSNGCNVLARRAIVLVAGDGCTPNLLAHEAPGVTLLDGRRLNGHGVSTHVGGGVDSRPARLHHPGFTGLVVGDVINATLLAIRGGRIAGEAEKVARALGF